MSFSKKIRSVFFAQEKLEKDGAPREESFDCGAAQENGLIVIYAKMNLTGWNLLVFLCGKNWKEHP